MRSSYLRLAILATLSSLIGTFGRAIPHPNLSSSQLPESYPTTVVGQGHPKQFLPENVGNWANGINPHVHSVPLIDTDNAHAQSHRQQREISLDDGTSPAENDSASVHQHASRATADWNKYVQKGQELINNLENALKNKKAIDSKFNIFRGWKPSDKKPETLPSVVGSAMDSDGIPTVQSQHYKYWEAKDPQSPSQYSGFFESGSNPKAMVEKRISKNGNPSLQMSEVAFQLASWALDDGEESLQKLEYIYKPEIQNPLTVDIMKQAYANTCDKGDRIVFKPDSEEFKSLLGSPNGALVPRMLIDHADFFGKTVKEIRLYLEKDMMVFKLG